MDSRWPLGRENWFSLRAWLLGAQPHSSVPYTKDIQAAQIELMDNI